MYVPYLNALYNSVCDFDAYALGLKLNLNFVVKLSKNL